LVHVLQQRGSSDSARRTITPSSHPAEVEARSVSEAVISGGAVSPVRPAVSLNPQSIALQLDPRKNLLCPARGRLPRAQRESSGGGTLLGKFCATMRWRDGFRRPDLRRRNLGKRSADRRATRRRSLRRCSLIEHPRRRAVPANAAKHAAGAGAPMQMRHLREAARIGHARAVGDCLGPGGGRTDGPSVLPNRPTRLPTALSWSGP
jgi:hypothetical protein